MDAHSTHDPSLVTPELTDDLLRSSYPEAYADEDQGEPDQQEEQSKPVKDLLDKLNAKPTKTLSAIDDLFKFDFGRLKGTSIKVWLWMLHNCDDDMQYRGTVCDIAKGTGVSRGTAYGALADLINRDTITVDGDTYKINCSA